LSSSPDRAHAIGLRLKAAKTGVHLRRRGFVFLGQRIIGKPKGPKRFVYTSSATGPDLDQTKDQALTGRSTTYLFLADLLRLINQILRAGRPTSATSRPSTRFSCLGYYTWWRVTRWLCKKHPKRT
jgi:RNA-directed DNA polymerase